jgi:hypothetical protein
MNIPWRFSLACMVGGIVIKIALLHFANQDLLRLKLFDSSCVRLQCNLGKCLILERVILMAYLHVYLWLVMGNSFATFLGFYIKSFSVL